MKRDARADLEAANTIFPTPWGYWNWAREVIPHWINRAVEAESQNDTLRDLLYEAKEILEAEGWHKLVERIEEVLAP